MAPDETDRFGSNDDIHRLVAALLRDHAIHLLAEDRQQSGTVSVPQDPSDAPSAEPSGATHGQTTLLGQLAASVVQSIQANLATVLDSTQFLRDALRDIDGRHDVLIRKLSVVEQTTGDAVQALRQLQTYADTAFEWRQRDHGHGQVQLTALIEELTFVKQLSRDAVRALRRL